MVYLIEYAKSGRSVCKGPKKGCVSETNTIAKGELRLGVETDIGGTTRVTWRHWLCTTPKVLANMSTVMSEPEEITGFNTIKEEDQERIREAWNEGELPTNADKAEGDDSQSNDEKEKPEASSQSKDAESSKTAEKESDETSKDKAETKESSETEKGKNKEEEARKEEEASKEEEQNKGEDPNKEENGGEKEDSSNGAAKEVGNDKSKSATETPKRKASTKAKKVEKPRAEPTRRSTRVQAVVASKEKAGSAKEEGKPATLKRQASSSGTTRKKSKKN